MRLKHADEGKTTLEVPSDVVRVVGNEPVDIELRLHNHGDKTDEFFLKPARLPWGWIAIPLPAISRVAPGASESVTLRVFPPTIADPFREPFAIVIQVHTAFPSAVLVESHIRLLRVAG